mmetsp:Transcript_15522/g.27687  ORF Transcript_15522/g.27687 Transcript_15522/m.27687 type:complete len:235 (-) Transcript_15522:63-767(-)
MTSLNMIGFSFAEFLLSQPIVLDNFLLDPGIPMPPPIIIAEGSIIMPPMPPVPALRAAEASQAVGFLIVSLASSNSLSSFPASPSPRTISSGPTSSKRIGCCSSPCRFIQPMVFPTLLPVPLPPLLPPLKKGLASPSEALFAAEMSHFVGSFMVGALKVSSSKRLSACASSIIDRGSITSVYVMDPFSQAFLLIQPTCLEMLEPPSPPLIVFATVAPPLLILTMPAADGAARCA